MVCASIHTGFHLSRVTRGSSRLQSGLIYGAITLSGRVFQTFSTTFLLATLRPTPPRGKPLDFGLFRFRSPLLTESHSLSFPPLTEMFHFSGCRSTWTMNSSRSHWVHQWGFPIRRSSGQRLLPSHRGLSQVTASFIASQHQGIHLVPLVAYLNVSTYH